MPVPALSSSKRLSETQLFAEGLALQASGKLLAAEAHYQAVLARNPRNADANNGMGTLSIAADKPDFAIGFFEKAVAARPSDFRFLNNLGNVFMQMGRTEEGLPYLEKALKLKPTNYELMFNIGRAYQKMGASARGIEFLERAAASRPENPDGLLALAEALSTLGRNDEAEALFRKAATVGAPLSSIFMGIAAGRKQTAANNILHEIDHELTNPPPVSGVEADSGVRLHFAAAKTCIDLKLTDLAWSHLAAANGASPRFDIVKYEADITALIRTFNATFLASRANLGSPSQRPVFIVGMPRSGTSLTEQILSSHGDVVGAGELTYMHTIANKLFFSLGVREIFGDQVRAMTPPRALAFANEYLGKIDFFSTTAARVTDKMPHNFHLVGLIGMLFPHARIIYCRRDPLDNCFSIYSNALNDFHSYGADLATLGAYYRQHIRLMDHWQSVMPGRIFEMRYEALVDDLEGHSRKMVDFVGLPWDPACLQFFETDRTVATISKWQVRQPIYKTSVARWKPYEPHLGPLKEALGDLVEA
jgi:tetratricopeptide (TPR) repeat protein